MKKELIPFEYNGYHFTPYIALKWHEELSGEIFGNLTSDEELGMCAIESCEWRKLPWSLKDFREASSDIYCDLFLCEENGRLYRPATYEPLWYTGTPEKLKALWLEAIPERIKYLRTKIEFHSNLYYNEDAPEISDAEFDELMRDLKYFEEKYPQYASPDSPTQKVGGTASKSTFAKVEHAVPMLSLQDVFKQEEVIEFLDKHPDDTVYSVEQKIDGLSVSATYEYGIYVRGETRGDGYIGEDITENLRHVAGIPKKLKGAADIPVLEVRAEAYMPISQFERLNAEREIAGKKLFANPRNAAAGLLRMKDTGELKSSGLHAFTFNVQRIVSQNSSFQSHTESLRELRAFGFDTAPAVKVTRDGVLEAIAKIGADRPSYPYWIDGAVVKIDDMQTRQRLGATSKYPAWAVAYKYPSEQKETVITDIILQTGRTGRVTPVAILKPVELGGTTVTRATLHNPAYIERLDARVGALCTVEKSGEIIPAIVHVYQDSLPVDSERFEMDKCPECGSSIVINEDRKSARCPNEYCPAQFARHLVFFASRDCMDIAGFGPAIVNDCLDMGWIANLIDIYKLHRHRDAMTVVGGYGEKSVDKLLAAIEKSKDNDIDRLIKSLGIPGVGRHVGRELAKRYPDMDTIMQLSAAELETVKDVGSVLAEAISDYFSDPANVATINEMRSYGVNTISRQYGDSETGKLTGLTFVITGTLPSMGREAAASLIESHGGKISGSVSKKTSYVLAGEAAGSKLDKANQLGIPVISEDELTEMLSA